MYKTITFITVLQNVIKPEQSRVYPYGPATTVTTFLLSSSSSAAVSSWLLVEWVWHEEMKPLLVLLEGRLCRQGGWGGREEGRDGEGGREGGGEREGWGGRKGGGREEGGGGKKEEKERKEIEKEGRERQIVHY